MASKTSTSREQTSPEAEVAAGQNAMADATRQQMATTASAASAMLRALETFQQTQQHMLQRAALLQEQTAERLRQANTPVELLSIQSNMVMASLTDMAQYAQELMLATMKAQSEFVRPVEQQQGVATAAPQTASPLFQAWQAVFTAPMQGAAASMRH